jgi:ArsR family transcriptional regulator
LAAESPHGQLIDPELAGRRAEILKALGNPVRLRIVAYLCHHGGARVTDIADGLDLPQSTVSRQLSLLKLHHLVHARSDEGGHLYAIAMPQVMDLMKCLSSCKRGEDPPNT